MISEIDIRDMWEDQCDGDHCVCHRMMGNDFYFLPIGSCLREESKQPKPINVIKEQP